MAEVRCPNPACGKFNPVRGKRSRKLLIQDVSMRDGLEGDAVKITVMCPRCKTQLVITPNSVERGGSNG